MTVLYSHSAQVWKIADFGATSPGTTKRAVTTMAQRGTQGFRAPELISTSRFTNKVDIWAIGCIFYQILLRTPLFRDDYEVLQLSESRNVQSLSRLDLSDAPLSKAIRKHLSEFLHATLDIEPKNRPTAQALSSLFQSYCIIWDPAIQLSNNTKRLPPYSEWTTMISNTTKQPHPILNLLADWYESNQEKRNVKLPQAGPSAATTNEIVLLLEALADLSEKEKDWKGAIAAWRKISVINPSNAQVQDGKIAKLEAKSDPRLNEQLYKAAMAATGLATVKSLLEEGADVNAQGGYYGNALQAAACIWGNKEVVLLLFEKGADVNAQGGYYGNALQAAACIWGNKEVVLLLLEKGANVNAQGGHHGSALQAAVVSGDKEVVLLLLEKGANVNVQGGYYGNALQAAACSGDKEVVLLLLEKGANVNAQGGHHGSALQAARASGRDETALLLLEKGAR
jgi:Protein kinase domain/Ankyrin repeats (3 copies)